MESHIHSVIFQDHLCLATVHNSNAVCKRFNAERSHLNIILNILGLLLQLRKNQTGMICLKHVNDILKSQLSLTTDRHLNACKHGSVKTTLRIGCKIFLMCVGLVLAD